jgi:hypothetical protein
MSNKTFRPTAEKKAKICQEVIGKITNYEARMTNRLARWVEYAELYCGKTSTLKENSKNSPNSTELYKAVRSMSNMIIRMLLGQKPAFELSALDIIGHSDPNKLIKAEHYVTNQMDLARVDKNMKRAIDQLLLYGSVAVHHPFEPLRASFLGRKRYITSYRPVSLINCAFALDAYDIEESGWIGLSDIQSKAELAKLKSHDLEGKMYDLGEIAKAEAQSAYTPRVNTWVSQRMAWQGYVNQNFEGGMERTTYYGPLDCMNDGEEHCVEIVNREFIIRMESYDGVRPVSVTTINTLDVEPLGNGLGDMFRPLLLQLDETRLSLLNTITLAGANMFAKQKSLTDEDMDFAIRNFGIVNLENPNIVPISPNPATVAHIAGYEQSLIQQFRQASGATDTLQAVVSEDQSTATAVSLAMNESVRNLSVQAQCNAPTLLKQYVQLCLQNAQKYVTEPFVLSIHNAPITIIPSDLLIDVDVRIKTTTDQDFRPAKIKNLMSAAQLMMAAGPNAIPGYKINAGPTITEILKLLDVPQFYDSVTPLTEEDLLQMKLMSEMQTATSEQEEPGEQAGGGAQGERARGERPGKGEQRVMNKNMNTPMAEKTMQTPVGQVLTAPGSENSTTQAVRSASVG